MTGPGALLDSTLRALYTSISFAEGGEPHWARMEQVFHPQARLTRVTPEGVEYFDLRDFKAMALEMLSADARSCLARGVNSIQLLWQQGAWRVLSLLWDEETREQTLDVQQLFETERACVREP